MPNRPLVSQLLDASTATRRRWACIRRVHLFKIEGVYSEWAILVLYLIPYSDECSHRLTNYLEKKQSKESKLVIALSNTKLPLSLIWRKSSCPNVRTPVNRFPTLHVSQFPHEGWWLRYRRLTSEAMVL